MYNYNQIKWERREKKRKNLKRKWIKHWEWEIWWKQVDLQNKWLSRQWKQKVGLNNKKKVRNSF